MGSNPRPAHPARALAPLLLLWGSLGVVALSAGLAVWSAWTSRANTRQLLRDYAAFAAWSYHQRLNEELGKATWLILSPIGHATLHRNRDIPTAQDLEHYRETNLQACRCTSHLDPRTYFRFTLGRDGFDAHGVLPDAALRDSLLGVVAPAARRAPGTERAGALNVPGTTLLAFWGLMPTTWGDTVVYGFTADSAAQAATFAAALGGAPLLPIAVTGGHPNDSILAAEVRNAQGVVLFRSPAWPADEREWPFIATDSQLPARAGLITRMTLVPATAGSLLAGGLPRTPLPLLLLVGLLGLTAAAVAALQLRRAGQLARLRSDFVASVSHELRTPLAQLRLFLDTLRLKRYDTPEQQAWLVDNLSRETTRMEHLVENVLAASRFERGVEGTAPLETLDLGQQVEQGVAAFRPLAASRQATFDLQLTPGVAIQGEVAGFRQLLNNLLDNAVKFGPPGQRVTLSVERRNGHARLSVTDQGPGVPPTDLERIWEPYYRGSGSAARVVGGSGIGLTVVREVATRFGGTASVAPALGGGSTFTVTFPVAGEEAGG